MNRSARGALAVAAALSAALLPWSAAEAAAPSNDSYASPATLTGASGSFSGTNAEATKGAEDWEWVPDPEAPAGGKSVWFVWTAPASGWVQFDTLASSGLRDSYLRVTQNGSEVASNDDVGGADPNEGGFLSKVVFNATQGLQYRIQLDSWHFEPDDYGTYTLTWASVAEPADFMASGGSWAKASGTRIQLDLNTVADKDTTGDPYEVQIYAERALRSPSLSTQGMQCGPLEVLEDELGNEYSVWFCTVARSAFASATARITATPGGTGPYVAGIGVAEPDYRNGEDNWYEATAGANVICDQLGNSNNNTLTGTSGADILCGMGGNDTLKGAGGTDLIFGGAGVDTVLYSGAPAMKIDLRNQTWSTYVAAPKSTTSTYGKDRAFQVENATGGSGADTLYGNGAVNRLSGGDGNDFLQGNAGKDVLIGGAGTDTCRESTDTKSSCEKS